MSIGPEHFGVGTSGLLLLAGIGAGITGSTAGLASLVSYPALLAVGLPPVTANVTNTVALIGSSIGSVSGSRIELRGQGRDIRRWLVIPVVAGAVGAALLLLGPAGTFEGLVPYLIALASVLLLAGPRLRALRSRQLSVPGQLSAAHTPPAPERQPPPDHQPAPDHEQASDQLPVPGAPARRGLLVPVGLFLTCLYGGYFGAAAGVMILALLLLATDRTLPRANAMKNLLLGVANATAAVGFAVFADVRWAAVVPLGIGCLVGGRIGPAVVRRVPPEVLRWVIALAGFALAVKLWLG